MLTLCSEITRILGQYEGLATEKPTPQLRKSNRVMTIQASLAIEGNTLQIEQVTDIIDGKRVLGSKKEILEVQNAVKAYDLIPSFKPHSDKSLRSAHGILMKGLALDSGKWRSSNVGIFHGDKVAHAAPQAKRVPELMNQLFDFLKNDKETHPLILSSIFHYELEFIHPFSDGNGRIGRLWQTVLLADYHPLFEFTPIESIVKERQQEYYRALGASDKEGSANPFIEFSLSTIQEALESLRSALRPGPLNTEMRLEIARDRLKSKDFSRKDYLEIFKTISTATASRDLALGVESKVLKSFGDRRLTRYRFKSKG